MFDLRGWLEKKKVGETAQIESPDAFVPVASVSDIPPGTGKVVVVRGREIGLFHVDGQFHAINNICPHQYRPIGTAEFNGRMLTCLWHSFEFDIETGACPKVPQYRLQKYRVLVEDGTVFVSFSQPV